MTCYAEEIHVDSYFVDAFLVFATMVYITSMLYTGVHKRTFIRSLCMCVCVVFCYYRIHSKVIQCKYVCCIYTHTIPLGDGFHLLMDNDFIFHNVVTIGIVFDGNRCDLCHYEIIEYQLSIRFSSY